MSTDEFYKLVAKRWVTIVLLLLWFFPLQLQADLPEEQPGSRYAGMAYSAFGLTDGWSIFSNQAGLGYQNHIWVGAHHENRFASADLNFSAIGFHLPLKSGAIGISVKRLGFALFSQSKLGVAYGMKLAPSLSAGVQLNGHHTFVAGEYGNATAITAEGGIIYSPSKSLNVGFHVANPTRSSISQGEQIPTLLNLGMAYQFTETVLVTGGVEKNLDADFNFKIGVEFVALKNLSFRTGMASKPSLLGFGLGYKAGPLQIDIAFTRHQYLGFTPHFSLSYTFNTPKRGSESQSE